MSFLFNTPHQSHANTLLFTAHKKQDYLYFSYIYKINVDNKTYFKPYASHVIHFPIQPTLPSTFKTSEIEVIFPSTPPPYFNSRFNSTSDFLQVYQNTKPEPNSCFVIIQMLPTTQLSLHQDILAILKFRLLIINHLTIKFMMLTLQYRQFFIHTIPISQNEKLPVSRSFLKKANIGINNLQASQFLNRPLPSPTYSPNTQHFVMKYKFQYPDVTDEEYLKLCVISVKYQHCYATHRNDVGKIASSFTIRLKPNAKLQTQRPTKIPIHY